MHSGEAFLPGTMVLVTLGSPREKFWGKLLSLDAAGLSLLGIDLNSFGDFAQLVKSDEPATPGVIFFPMHRIERVELDIPGGGIPSLSEQFAAKTGKPAGSFFQEPAR